MTRQERGSCFRFSTAPTHFALQREMYDSVKIVSVSVLHFGNNLLQEKKKKGGDLEAIWDSTENLSFSSHNSFSNY